MYPSTESDARQIEDYSQCNALWDLVPPFPKLEQHVCLFADRTHRTQPFWICLVYMQFDYALGWKKTSTAEDKMYEHR